MDFPPLDHLGVVVSDLNTAIEQYRQRFGMRVQWREPLTTVPAACLGIVAPRAQQVRLRGAMLRAGHDEEGQTSVGIELHEFCDGNGLRLGWSHAGFSTTTFAMDYSRLSLAGVVWFSHPHTISTGPLAGRQWVYGLSNDSVVELCTPVPSRSSAVTA